MFATGLCQLKNPHLLFKRSKAAVMTVEVSIWPLLMQNENMAQLYNCVLYQISCHVGELSLDEFIDGARRDKWVMKMLQMDVNPGDWLNDRRRSANF